MSCANRPCKKDWDNPDNVLVTVDGDFCCSPECAKQWKTDRDRFLNGILPNDKLYNEWIGGK